VTTADALLVRIGSGRYAVGLGHVAEVGKVPPLTRVPGVPVWLTGVANWRGRILPVLDLRPLLGADVVSFGSTARLVVLSTDGTSVGVLADSVEGTSAIGATPAPMPAVLPGTGAELVCGQVPRHDGPLAVLDVEAVLRLRERLPRGRRSA
jgi:purine-binding chemotaxis protein CheW